MKPVSFSNFKEIRKMTLNEFNRWLTVVYREGVQEGYRLSEAEVVAEVTEEQLLEIILSVKGVGRARAEQIVEAIIQGGSND